MKPYALRVKKNRLTLELSSENPELIAVEFAKIAKDFLATKIQSNLYADVPLATKPLPAALKNNLKTKIKAIETVEEPKVEEKIVETKELPKVLPAALKKTLKSKVTATEKVDKVIQADFAKMLAQKAKEESNVVEKKTSELQKTYQQMQSLISEKTLKNHVDYVVAAAYCLSQYEGVLRFTEEKIKAKVLPFLAEEFEHNDVLDAIDRRFLRVIPDFTGVSDTIEFELTEQGEEYFLNEL